MKKARLPLIPFKHWFSYDELVELLHRLAAARPALASLQTIAQSPEGRQVWCLTLTDTATGPAADKPAYLIHANIHASEVSGTHAALFTAQRLLADYPRNTRLLADIAVHIVPRLNPDGAEFAIQTGGPIRSRNDHQTLVPNTLLPADLDGDGRIRQLRLGHPDGDHVADPEDPRLLIRRQAGDPPPFYKVMPEGMIHDWDGSEDFKLGGRSIDWNRQWSYDWRPEPLQGGAGDFPYSEPEMHGLAQFIHRHPNLFGILGYHTGPAAFLRPPSMGSDNDLDQGDLLRMREFGRVATALTDLPCVPIFDYRPHFRRELQLHGHFPSTGYQHLGLFVFEFELGMLCDSAGEGTAQWQQQANEEEAKASVRRIMQWWDEHRDPPALFAPWRAFAHPQLGPVELGGIAIVDWVNMTMGDLRKRCAGTHAFTLHHAQQHPLVRLEDLEVGRLAGNIWRLRARCANRGGLPTHVTQVGAGLTRLTTVRVSLDPGAGVEVISQRRHFELGHLAAPAAGRQLEWFVRAAAGCVCELRIDAGTGGRQTVTVSLA